MCRPPWRNSATIYIHRRNMDNNSVMDTMESCLLSSYIPRLMCPWRRLRTGGARVTSCLRTVIGLIVSLSLFFSPQQVLGDIMITSPTQDEITVTLGQTLSIQCISDEGTPVKWSYGGMLLEDANVIRTDTDSAGRLISTLNLREVSDVDQGIYICSNPEDFYDRDELEVKVHTSEPPQTVRIVEPDGNELRTPAGQRFTLKCVGEEGSVIRWLHNDVPIHGGTRVIITTSQDVDDHKMKSLLTRLSAGSTEGGRYSCQDQNRPSSTDTVRVTLLGARDVDTIAVELVQPSSSQLAVDLFAGFTLQCRGDRRASLTWYINNTLISLLDTVSAKMTMGSAEGAAKMTMLSVERATYADSGLYACRNGMNLDDKDEVTVNVRDPGEPPEDDIIEEPEVALTEMRREVLRVGSAITLQCSLEAPTEYITEWYKDDRKLANDGKYVIKDSGNAELHIQNTDWTDAGVYRCTFLYRDTGIVRANILFNLTTIPCPSLAPPQNGTFVTCPVDPVYGDFCTFRCYKGYRLTDKRPVICDRYDGMGTYVWNRATPKCIGLTPDDLLDSVPTSLSHVLLRVGSSLKLQCRSGSSWVKGGTRLQNGEKYTIEEHALIIKHTGRGDTGIYDCNVVREDYTLKGIKKFNVTTLPCPKLPVLGNGSVAQCTRDPVYGETCVFKCHPGYKLTGSRSQVCELAHEQFRAYWTGNEKPVCVRDIRSSASGYSSCASHRFFSQTLLAVQVVAWLLYTTGLLH